MRKLIILCLVVMVSGSAFTSFSRIIQVGNGKQYRELREIEDLTEPGDTIEVDGGATYASGATFAENRITLLGIRTGDEARPEISGSTSYGLNITGDDIVVEGFHVTGMPKGIGVFGNNIIVRDCIISECNHGLIGYGTGTGNVTVEYCEFVGNGIPTGGATQHQIYMATDEITHPGSVFRLQFCYLHDGVEGDNVKSRAERNEIYYNWIEVAGSSGHGLGLFAPDPDDNDQVEIDTRREDADVVGNVIIQSRNSCARIGGDLPGNPTNGRYRFVNNTFILTGSRGDAVRTFNMIETLEMFNNVVYSADPDADIRVINDADGEWVHSPRTLIGANNWISEHATRLPSASEWNNTLSGTGSPFVDAENGDFIPGAESPLIDGGAAETPTVVAYPFADPLFPPVYLPSSPSLMAPGSARARPTDGHIDIGAFEAGSQQVVRELLVEKLQIGHPTQLPAEWFGIDGRKIVRNAVPPVPGVWVQRKRVEGATVVRRTVGVR
ncbi:MAG: hypothetical protein JW863_17200 [Chitinispirillaceae bacterium]|nr:hypothetical protein [Chitinispirillaceae bacterium]